MAELDFFLFLFTFFCCLLYNLEYGILICVGLNLLFIIYSTARPNIVIKETTVKGHSVLLLKPDHGLTFPASRHFSESVASSHLHERRDATLVIDGSHIVALDATTSKNLKSLTDDLNAKHLPVIFWNWSHDAMTTLLSMDPEMEQYFRSSNNVQGLFQDFGDIVPSRKSTFVLISEG